MSNEEIKSELIKKGWKIYPSGFDAVQIRINCFQFVYHAEHGGLIFHNLHSNSWYKELLRDITIDRIKALIYALTGEKI